jgi:hypothetical protein
MSTPIKIVGPETEARMAQEFHVIHTPHEFLLSIIEVIPQMAYVNTGQEEVNVANMKPQARLQNTGILQKIVGRYGMSPAAFKKLVVVAQRNLQQYEAKFGEIAIQPPEGMA